MNKAEEMEQLTQQARTSMVDIYIEKIHKNILDCASSGRIYCKEKIPKYLNIHCKIIKFLNEEGFYVFSEYDGNEGYALEQYESIKKELYCLTGCVEGFEFGLGLDTLEKKEQPNEEIIKGFIKGITTPLKENKMSYPKNIYIVVYVNYGIYFSIEPVKEEAWIQDCVKIDENTPAYEIMDWLADGMPKNDKFESVFKEK
jgi:hypothetical protein